MRAELMSRLRTLISDRGWTQQGAAKRLVITQSRVSDLVRGKWDKFSLDMLITLAASERRVQKKLVRLVVLGGKITTSCCFYNYFIEV